ncbi:42_t:CDS:1 [Paraglomus brasilianum]|uniref:42_t:CDS:1 n=1 Tax=Paraglomus brasilianum TaxID=144538 RepID=A0A9N9EYP5_9GLOM|nr:42_t:CDS:1 [Paraglomus brasilianum]
MALFTRTLCTSSIRHLSLFTRPLLSTSHRTFISSAIPPTTYEADKDYWLLKSTLDDIRAKYGLSGGSRIKDHNLDAHSDLEIDITPPADVKKLAQINNLLETASKDFQWFISETENNNRVNKKVWLAEDDDMSGNMDEAIKAYRESTVMANSALHVYDLEESIEQKPPGFQHVH